MPSLVPDATDRQRVMDAVRRIAEAQGALSPKAKARLRRVEDVWGLSGEPAKAAVRAR